MKARLLWAIVLVLSQALVLTGGVTAQGTPPPNGRPDGLLAPHNANVNHAMQPSAPGTVPLGQPGTSYRYVQQFGVTDEPYPADVQHLNQPVDLFIDGSDNLFVLEYSGRLQKFDTGGSNLLTIGTAGLEYRADYVFAFPMGTAVDGSGNIWVVDLNRAAEYSSSGTHLQDLPPADPWQAGSDNQHFDNPQGVAFDSAGRMYVSDWNNQRVQVYSFSGNTPVYSTTIGVTGVSGADNTHFNNPAHIALDGSDRLYVADDHNQRIQRCVFAAGWICSTFLGVTGVSGSDLTHLNNPYAVAFGISNTTYIADGYNDRVLKCDATPICTVFAGVSGVFGSDNSHFGYVQDVAVDSAGNVFVADFDNARVQKFNSAGVYQATRGTTRVPYVPDMVRYNSPLGIAVTGDGSLYFTEYRGHRAIKLDAAGARQWAFGVAGVYPSNNTDNTLLGAWWGGMQGNPAVDAAGQMFIPDSGNNRIQILDANGNYLSTFGSSGQGNNQFSCPNSVFIRPSDGNIYVADGCNNRVQVFDHNQVYQATLGVTGVGGSDNAHFGYPRGVAVDASGHIFVADSNNHRVQMCTLAGATGTCTTFAGQSGVPGGNFDQFSYPASVAVDAAGRVYVVDLGNNRVEVFDAAGGYLTTIGGNYGGANGSQMRAPGGVAVDAAFNVYVTDTDNDRIQKFALGVPGWTQTNITGFGSPYTMIPSLAVFAGQLYAGTWNANDSSYHIWRTPDGRNWQQAGSTDFGGGVSTMLPFSNMFYAGTWSGNVWRSPDGLGWTRVISGGFGGDSHNAMARFSVYNNQLYGATYNTIGGQIWRTSDGTTWTQFGASGLGDTHNCCPIASEIFGGQLYFGVENDTSAAQVWRTDGLTVTALMTDGFGDSNNHGVSALASFNGFLYAATTNSAGDQVWRSPNGTDWTNVATGGLGNPNNADEAALEVFGGKLYLVLGNDLTGAEVWRSDNGTQWTQAGLAGFGSSNNYIPERDSTLTAFQGNLYVGVNGWRNTGGQVWQLLNQLYLPLVRR